MFVTTSFVAASILFCRHKSRVLSQQTRVCRDKTFVATNMILIAAPTEKIISEAADDLHPEVEPDLWTL